MNIISNYTNNGEETVYKSFICELDANTVLRFEFQEDAEDKKCKITMEDKVSGVIDISSRVNSEEIKALIKTLRIVAMQVEVLEKTK